MPISHKKAGHIIHDSTDMKIAKMNGINLKSIHSLYNIIYLPNARDSVRQTRNAFNQINSLIRIVAIW